MNLSARCPACENPLGIPSPLHSKPVKCPHCGKIFTAPDRELPPGALSVLPVNSVTEAAPHNAEKEATEPQPILSTASAYQPRRLLAAAAVTTLGLSALKGVADVATHLWFFSRFTEIVRERLDPKILERIYYIGLSVDLALLVLTATAFIAWLHGVRRNLPALGAAALQYPPFMTILCWFIPLANLALPAVVTQEIWRASDPHLRTYDKKLRRRVPGSPIIGIWWGFFLAALALVYVSLSHSPDIPTIDALHDMLLMGLLANLVTIAAAGAGVAVVIAVQTRQRKKAASLQKYAAAAP